MNRMRGKGHAGGHKDTVPVTLAALRHDDLSVFMFQSVPSYYISFSFHSVVFVKVVLRNSERSHLRCGFKTGWHFMTACLWHRCTEKYCKLKIHAHCRKFTSSDFFFC